MTVNPDSFRDTTTDELSNPSLQTITVTPGDFLIFTPVTYTLPANKTVEDLTAFVSSTQQQLTTPLQDADLLSISTNFFPTLGIRTNNWLSFSEQYPTLAQQVQTIAFGISTHLTNIACDLPADMNVVDSNNEVSTLDVAKFLLPILAVETVSGQVRTFNPGKLFYDFGNGQSPLFMPGDQLYNALLEAIQKEHLPFTIENKISILSADAGEDISVEEDHIAILTPGLNTYITDENFSTDENFQMTWEQISGPKFQPVDAHRFASFEQIYGDQIATFRLTVTDDRTGQTSEDEKQVTVLNKNDAPTVSIDNITGTGGQPIIVNVSGYDPNGDSLTYTWKSITDPSISINTSEDSPQMKFTAPQVTKLTNYIFEVTASDGNGGMTTKEVTVSIRPKSTAVTQTKKTVKTVQVQLPNPTDPASIDDKITKLIHLLNTNQPDQKSECRLLVAELTLDDVGVDNLSDEQKDKVVEALMAHAGALSECEIINSMHIMPSERKEEFLLLLTKSSDIDVQIMAWEDLGTHFHRKPEATQALKNLLRTAQTTSSWGQPTQADRIYEALVRIDGGKANYTVGERVAFKYETTIDGKVYVVSGKGTVNEAFYGWNKPKHWYPVIPDQGSIQVELKNPGLLDYISSEPNFSLNQLGFQKGPLRNLDKSSPGLTHEYNYIALSYDRLRPLSRPS